MTEVPRLCVLVLAGGADWEAGVLSALHEADVVVTKRCVDVPDLMASASIGGASVAVVAGDLAPLDAEAVMHLLRYDVRTLGVTTDPTTADRLARLGVAATAAPAEVASVAHRVAAREVVVDPDVDAGGGRHAERESAGRPRKVAVWGPAGAPGRTTVAVGLAAEMAAAGQSVVVVDADPYGGAVAQHLGILDEASGLLAVARKANLGTLDEVSFVRSCRRVGERLEVLTGLPRADRRVEVRPGVLTGLLDLATERGHVLVDCGFCLEGEGDPLGRDRMTLEALSAADDVVVVGSAEPTGLARLARGLVELREVIGAAPVRVVVNRMRDTLGWSERDIVGMVEGYARPVAVHFVPADTPALDRALVTGRALTELGESRAGAALAEVARSLLSGVRVRA